MPIVIIGHQAELSDRSFSHSLPLYGEMYFCSNYANFKISIYTHKLACEYFMQIDVLLYSPFWYYVFSFCVMCKRAAYSRHKAYVPEK